MYTIDDLHYNSRGVIQVSPTECFEDLAETLKALGRAFERTLWALAL